LEVNSEQWKNWAGEKNEMKFKAEMCLLVVAIALFALSAFFYSYQPSSESLTFSVDASSYPYRMQALTFVGFGSALMLTASISYSKRSKNFGNSSRRV
jgi:hypothetical protein